MILNNLIVNYGLTLKFPKSNEYNSPEGTRENNTKEMAKKDYKSPEMNEVNVQVESLMQTASLEQPTCPSNTCPSDSCNI